MTDKPAPKDSEDKPMDGSLKSLLDRVKNKAQAAGIAEEAKRVASEVHQVVAPENKVQPNQLWLPFAPMPTDMCRVSPFFPMSQKQLSNRPIIEDLVITQSSWGQIRYTGPKLSTYEEDVLLAILALLDTPRHRTETEQEGKKTYTYTGPIKPILELMGYSKPGSREYKRVKDAIKLLRRADVEMVLKAGNTPGGPIFIFSDYNTKTKSMTVTVNPYFYEMYVAGSVTLLDVLRRAKLDKPISKALYRFVMSHRDFKWAGNFLTLAASLNLDQLQPQFKIRQQIKSAITELKNKNILTNTSGFVNKDTVKIKASQTKQRGQATALPAG